MQRILDLEDADKWSHKLLERVPGTEFLKLNIAGGGQYGSQFDAIQDLSAQRSIPIQKLQLATIQIGSNKRQITHVTFKFKKLYEIQSSQYLRTHVYGGNDISPLVNDYNVLDNKITQISGTWGGSPILQWNTHSWDIGKIIESLNIKFQNGEEIVQGNKLCKCHGACSFNISAPQDFYIANIYGRSGSTAINQVGVYLQTDRPLEWSQSAHSEFPEQFKKQIRTFLLCVGRLYRSGEIKFKVSEDVMNKIVKKILLPCGMTVEQYVGMVAQLVFDEVAYKEQFNLEVDSA